MLFRMATLALLSAHPTPSMVKKVQAGRSSQARLQVPKSVLGRVSRSPPENDRPLYTHPGHAIVSKKKNQFGFSPNIV